MWQSWSLPEETSGETLSEGTASVVVETPGLKGSWRKAEVWYTMAGSKSLRSQERPLEMVQPQLQWTLWNTGDTRTMDDHQGEQQVCGRTTPSL